MGVRERPAREPARESGHGPAFAGQVPRERPGRQHARVRARVLVQGRSADGLRETLPRMVNGRGMAALLLATGVALAAPPRTVAELLAQSPASDWRAVDPDNTLYMELPSGRVVIEL